VVVCVLDWGQILSIFEMTSIASESLKLMYWPPRVVTNVQGQDALTIATAGYQMFL